MKRLTVLACLWCAASVVPALAQEGQKQSEAGGQEIWFIVNFVILVAGLGVLIRKSALPFFSARRRKIRTEIIQGEEARQDAEKRAAEVDRRLASLGAEISGLQADSRKELENERERMRQRTAAERARISASAQQEIAAAGKTARAELKRYSAELAIGLAERKIRSRMNAETQDALVGGFVEMLSTPDGGAPAVQA
jgi:F-type H+-transporting ATPase subunit b